MEEPSNTSDAPAGGGASSLERAEVPAARTLAVLLCMHRSGSSLMSNLLQRLGMSLGPFELLGASEHNPHGHFEAVPIYRLDQELLAGVFGFHEDVPTSEDVHRRFCQSEGCWTLEEAPIGDESFQRGRELIEQLVQSGPISGFKDPRIPLLWPFWERVFAGFPKLRVVPIFLARSPHEIAMSIFTRSRGALGYREALDVTAVHYKRLNAILDGWTGDRAVVRFEPQLLPDDARKAAEICGLTWNEDIFAEVYDAACRHHEPARVAHEAQSLYERLCRINAPAPINLNCLERDSAIREDSLRSRLLETKSAVEELRGQINQCREQLDRYQRQLDSYRRVDSDSREAIAQLRTELSLITGSRTWRLRQRLVNMPPLKWRASSANGTGAPPVAADCVAPVAPADPDRLDRPCTVIIPVYNAFAEAEICLRSVLECTQPCYKVLVVDDCSPDGAFADSLPPELRDDVRVEIVRNECNLGFVKTCNWAIQQSAPSDVVLLNSDTEVTPRWLEKLRQAAASRMKVGTVTPLTNNGTVCSVPEFLADNELPPGYDVTRFAALVEESSAREYPELPTCVGFCVYIKREVIERIGMFDADAFGRGYGEENDFSCRLQAAGYADILDDATFVYHHGSMSFKAETNGLVAEHLKILAKKHPQFDARVQRFVLSNPLRAVHRRIYEAMLGRWSDNAIYSVLHILHHRPITHETTQLAGGIEYHVADLVRMIPEAAHWSLYAAAGEYCLTAHVPGNERHYRVPMRGTDLGDLISRDLFDVVHVHHASSFDYRQLADCLLRHGRYYVSMHDFRLCCPTINLLKPDGKLCTGRECATACRQSSAAVQSLRSTTDEVLQHAQAVFHFSQSTKDEFTKILAGPYPWKYIEHGIDVPRCRDDGVSQEAVRPSSDVPLKVAFLGGIGFNKGADLVRQVVRDTRLPGGAPVEWHLVGLIDGEIDPCVRQHGRYDRGRLPAIMNAVSPHLVAILSIWPETYCYTFDEALACGIPIVATPLGAPAERLRQHQCGWLVESLTSSGVMTTLQHVVDNWNEYCAIRGRIPSIELNRADRVARQYLGFYQTIAGTPPLGGRQRLSEIETKLEKAARRRRIPLSQVAGRILSGCLAALETVKVRGLAARVARRVLSVPTRRRIAELRQAGHADRSAWLHESKALRR